MNRSRVWIRRDHAAHHARTVGARPIRLGTGEVTAGLGFDHAEDIRDAAASVLVVPVGHVRRACRTRRADVGVQGDRLLIETHDGFHGIERSLVEREDILHPREALGIKRR